MRFLILLLCAAGAFAQPAARPVRVQVVTGGHPHAPSFYTLFEGYDDIEATVNPHPSAFATDMVRRVDVLVLYDLADTTGEKERQNLRNFVEARKGVVVLHHALADNYLWTWWYEQVVGGRFLMAPDGGLAGSTAKAPVELSVKLAGKHAITAGMEPFRLMDEAYKGMWLSPKSKVLLETDSPENDKVLAWIGPCATSRVVAIQLGHDRAAHQNATYRKLVKNAILWAAGKIE